MSSIEHIEPLLFKRRQDTPRLACLGLARQLTKSLEILPEVRVDGAERGSITLLCDPILFPFLLFLQGWQLGLASQDSRRSHGLPFENLESQSSANLSQMLARVICMRKHCEMGYIPLPKMQGWDRFDGRCASTDPEHGYF